MTYIIAEVGVNHDGELSKALKLVRAAVDAGADAVKFQTFIAEELVTRQAEKAAYQNRNDPGSVSQLEMLKQLQLEDSDFLALRDECKMLGIEFMTTCFDYRSLNFAIDQLKPDILKIGSGDLTDLPFLVAHARTGRRIILSTGMATLGEIEDAIAALAFGFIEGGTTQPSSYDWLKENYLTEESVLRVREKVTVLHCVTDYPARAEDLNLKAIPLLKAAFGLEIGYSDHSLGIEAACAAVALGATCLEKHLTFDPAAPGPDHSASLSPQEFRGFVDSVRLVEKATSRTLKSPSARELPNRRVARKYLVAREDIKKGTCLEPRHLAVKRSKTGLPPRMYWDLVGTYAVEDFAKGENIKI